MASSVTGQRPRQPAGRRDHHGEGHADQHEAAEAVDEAGHRRREPPGAEHPQEDVGAQAGDEELDGGKDPVGLRQGQDQEEEAEGVEQRVLAGRQEGHAAEEVGVPQRQLPGRQRLQGEAASRRSSPGSGRPAGGSAGPAAPCAAARALHGGYWKGMSAGRRVRPPKVTGQKKTKARPRKPRAASRSRRKGASRVIVGAPLVGRLPRRTARRAASTGT